MTQSSKIPIKIGYLWVTTPPKNHGLWSMGELWVIPANQLGGREISWVITEYGLPQVWVRTESTVCTHLLE